MIAHHPDVYRLVFCESCGEMLGVEDHIRIRSEHFHRAGAACRGMRMVEVAPTGATDEAMYARRAGQFSTALDADRTLGKLGAVAVR